MLNSYDLFNYTEELSHRYFEYLTKPLLAYIEADNKTALSDPVFIDFFEEYCKENHIVEFYVIDNHGSFLCVDTQGKESFLIVHTNHSLSRWTAEYKNELMLFDEQEAVSGYKKIPFFGIGKEAWEISSDEWKKYLHPATVLSGREKYFIASLNELSA